MFFGRYEEALEGFDQALRLNPGDAGAAPSLAGRATALFYLNRHGEASAWAERAYTMNPTHTLALRALAITAAVCGDQQRAHMAYCQFAPDGHSQKLERTKRLMKRADDFAKYAAAIDRASLPE